MGSTMSDSPPTVLELVAQIVTAHCASNTVALPALIQQVHAALTRTDREGSNTDKPVPAVHPRKSVFPDYIICLEDGKKMKMLRRHLSTAFGMTPDHYRARWDLPPDYPMVAPNYADKRSTLAKQSGLGRRPAAKLTLGTAAVSGRRGSRNT